ncbi:MAG: hypothetical protein K8T10_21895 [Candidatus Eremiobacteraeota bacterium]|nr:hypothetical protein [Candidatus Eremiobacteraeota bacterium]
MNTLNLDGSTGKKLLRQIQRQVGKREYYKWVNNPGKDGMINSFTAKKPLSSAFCGVFVPEGYELETHKSGDFK